MKPNKTRMKRYLTTSEAGRLFGVASRTVAKWFDTGLLTGWRIPGSNDRRFSVESIRKFARENNFTSPDLDGLGQFQGLLVTPSVKVSELLAEEIGPFPLQITWVADMFSAGVNLSRQSWDAVIIDCSIGRTDALAMLKKLGALSKVRHKIVLVCEDENDENCFALAGANLVLHTPLEVAVLAENLKIMLD